MQDSSDQEFSFKGIAPDDRSPVEGTPDSAVPAPGALPGQAPESAAGSAPAPAIQPVMGMPVPAPEPMPEPMAPLPSASVEPARAPVPAPALAAVPTPSPAVTHDLVGLSEEAASHQQSAQVSAEAMIQPAGAPVGQIPDPAVGQPGSGAGGTMKVNIEVEENGQPGGRTVNPRHLVQGWLADMVKAQASDLILRAGGRPSQRLDGKISFLPGQVPGPGPMLEVLHGILGEKRMETFEETGAADAALDLDGLGRFRINAYKQMGEPAIVIRRINEDAPSLDDLHLPADSLKDLALRKRGLVLVTGVAGSGKSTTLSAMIQFMNQNVERHVVTLEDPVELLFKERYCVISQREVGTDTTSFKQGIKHALRQSPDVIFIGEMRDAETVLAALEAIETGHLVMSTMHTVNAAQTVDRILGFFPAERHVQIRQRMADTLAGVLSMRLVPRIGGGQVPAFELMQVTPQVRELLEEGKTTELGRVIQGGMERGIVSFNDRLFELVQTGFVDMDDAIQASDRPDELIMMVRGIQGGQRAAAKANSQATAETDGTGTPMRRRTDVAGDAAQPGAPQPPAGQPGAPGDGMGGSNLRLRGSGDY